MLPPGSASSLLLWVCGRLGALPQQFELGGVDLSQADVLGLHLQPALRLQANGNPKYASARSAVRENAVCVTNGTRLICGRKS